MAAASTKAALIKMFKDVYLNRDLTNYSFRKTPLGDVVKKVDDFYGNNLIFPFNYGVNTGIYPTLDATNPAGRAGTFDKWVMDDTKPMYGRLTLDNPSMMRASKDIGSYLRLKQKETKEILTHMKTIRLGWQLWGDGSSAIGRIAEAVTGATDTTPLTVQNDGVNFHKDMLLNASGTKTGGAIRTDKYRVTKVERYSSAETCKLTLSRVSGAADDWAINDYLYMDGFYDAAMHGIQSFITASLPGTGGVPATLFSMDRTDEPEMKAGWRGTFQGSVWETIKNLASVMGQYVDPDFSSAWLSHGKWYQLEQELKAVGQLNYSTEKRKEFGTNVIVFNTPQGDVSVVCDPFCPSTDVFMLRHKDIEIHTTGPLIHLADEDLEALRLADADGLEIRYRSLAQTIIPYPWHCGRAPLQ